MGPLKIIRQVNLITIQLQLPPQYCISPSFHISLLKPAHEPSPATDSDQSPPPPLDIDGSPVYLVSSCCSHFTPPEGTITATASSLLSINHRLSIHSMWSIVRSCYITKLFLVLKIFRFSVYWSCFVSRQWCFCLAYSFCLPCWCNCHVLTLCSFYWFSVLDYILDSACY